MPGRWGSRIGFLGMVAVVGFINGLSILTEDEWMEIHDDLSGCTAGVMGFCSHRKENGDVVVSPFAKSRESCDEVSGFWHDRFPSYKHWRDASLEADAALHASSSDLSIALPTFAAVVKFSSSIRVNSFTRARMPVWLQAAQLVPCDSGAMYAYAHASRADLLHAKTGGTLAHAHALPPDAKLSSHLLAILDHPDDNEKEGGKPNMFHSFPNLLVGLQADGKHNKADTDEVATKWQTRLQGKATTKSEADDTVHIRVAEVTDTREVARTVSREPLCLFVEPQPVYRVLNEEARPLCQAGVPSTGEQTHPYWDAGIMGQGQVVGVADSGLDHQSCYFRDDNVPVVVQQGDIPFNSDTHRKIAQYYAFADNNEGEVGGHGTHVCGSVAGNEHLDGSHAQITEAAGGAPQAKIAFFDIGEANAQFLNVPGSLYNSMFPPAFSQGARIHTNSWGSDSNSYGANARDVDRYMFENQDFLVLFANGNSGPGAGTVGTPATSKNNIAVGASRNGPTNQEEMAGFSSQGPRYDGGFSPVLSAPGAPITSARSAVSGQTCDTVGMQGTSMATPLTAGHAALVRQYFVDGFYPSGKSDAFTPMGALIKAVLVNGAHTLTGPVEQGVVSNEQGYGAIQLNNTLRLDLDLEEGQQRSHFVDGDFEVMPVMNDGDIDMLYEFKIEYDMPFVAVLAWSDAPAADNAQKLLINDLDMTIECTGGCGDVEMWLPNGLTVADDVNNVEKVIIESAPLGAKLVVHVKATAVPQGPQPYAISISGGFKNPSGPGVALTTLSLVVFCVVGAGLPLYVAASMGYTKKTQDRIGMPKSHVSFWKDLPYLVTEGVVLASVTTYRGVKGCAKGTYRLGMKARGKEVAKTQARPRLQAGSMKRRSMKAIVSPPAASLWTKHIDPNSGQPYWFKASTGESSWTNPNLGGSRRNMRV